MYQTKYIPIRGRIIGKDTMRGADLTIESTLTNTYRRRNMTMIDIGLSLIRTGTNSPSRRGMLALPLIEMNTREREDIGIIIAIRRMIMATISDSRTMQIVRKDMTCNGAIRDKLDMVTLGEAIDTAIFIFP